MRMRQYPELVALNRVEHHATHLVRIRSVLEDVLDSPSYLARRLAIGLWLGLAWPELD